MSIYKIETKDVNKSLTNTIHEYTQQHKTSVRNTGSEELRYY